METLLGFIVIICVFALPVALIFLLRKIRVLTLSTTDLARRIALLEQQPREVAPAAPVPVAAPREVPPPLPQIFPQPVVRPPELPKAPLAKPPRPAIDWESFLGVKLFAWLGGFVLFLGVVFLVKYSFENNLVTPATRIAIGAVIGLALVGAGWVTARRAYRIPGQSLCATGVLVLYADIFGAHAFYDLISLSSAFTLMSAVTLAAFFLAVRLDAQVIVILGLLGGFLTPPLLTRGEGAALALFGYIALLNAGVAAVALRKRWDYLVLLSAIGTILSEFAWPPLYRNANAEIAALVFLAFEAQFLAIHFLRGKLPPPTAWAMRAAVALGASALLFALYLIGESEIAARPAFIFSFIFFADVGLLALALSRPDPLRIAGLAGSGVFLLLGIWTSSSLTHATLWWALGAFVIFALIHSGFAVWPPRARAPGKNDSLGQAVPLFPLVLLCLCVWRSETSLAVWLCLLVVDLVIVALAWRASSLFTLAGALVATFFTAGLWIFRAPPLQAPLDGFLGVIGGFGIFFSIAASLVARRVANESLGQTRHLPMLSAALPFVLLGMVVAKIPLPNPTQIFVVTLVLAVVLLVFGSLARSSWIAAVALVCTFAVEAEWHTLYFSRAAAAGPLIWFAAFFVLFFAYPYFARDARGWIAWAVSAAAGPLQFALILDAITLAFPAWRNGLLPAIFIVPYVLGVLHLLVRERVAPASGDARLAWQAGVALFFLTLIFPVQFQREWITLGWALEGLALIFAFRFVPNRAMRLVGGALLVVAFARLAVNPAVLEYHPRSGTRIWNWYLYAYGLTSVCLLAGARFFQRGLARAVDRVVMRLLYSLGTLLVFLLLNIEIADYFSIGPTLTFSFSGNFARDMTYSIAWALFAFALLILGMKKRARFVRYAAVSLLLVTLAKLFLHDLNSLSQLYRIGAFIGVALILIVASFVYQKFLAPSAETPGEKLQPE